MKHVIYIVFLCILSSCISDYDQPIHSKQSSKNAERYYNEAVGIFSAYTESNTRSTEPVLPALPPVKPVTYLQYSRFYEYGEKFENVLALNESELESICNDSRFQEMCQQVETDIDNAFSVIYDYMTVDELSLCEEAIINYIKSGGHNIDFLEDLTFEMENETVYKLTCYAAALLDEYVEEQSLIDINNRKVVSESKQYSCEEILQAKLALLTVEVTWSYVFTAWIPGFDILSISLTTVYAMASTTAYKHEYDECVKKRNNSGKKP